VLLCTKQFVHSNVHAPGQGWVSRWPHFKDDLDYGSNMCINDVLFSVITESGMMKA
jgi:hypothetical protein